VQLNDEDKALIVANLDVLEFLDILGLEVADLINIPEIEELCEEQRQELLRACR
jgi:hypothetical protein